MNKLSSVALSAVLVVAGVGASVSAEAHPYVSVGIGIPGVAVVDPFPYAPAYFAPYYYAHGRYWHRDYDRDRGERFHSRWEHDGEHRWDRR
jgi:hypothetical protein